MLGDTAIKEKQRIKKMDRILGWEEHFDWSFKYSTRWSRAQNGVPDWLLWHVDLTNVWNRSNHATASPRARGSNRAAEPQIMSVPLI